MTQLIGVVVLSLGFSQVSSAQGLHSGTVIGVIDGPTLQPDQTVEVSGWAFHTGGAAILRVRVWIDCNPFTGASCGLASIGMASEAYYRRDVQNAFPQFQVPITSGWELAAHGWNYVQDGLHWLYGGAADAEHGPLLWTQLNPKCFKKAGAQILPC